MKNYRHSINEDMAVKSRETYSIGEKIFCCKCFDCLQNEVVLTTDIRRQTLQRMIKNFTITEDQDEIEDPIKLMILIYLCVDESIPKKFIYRCQINPDRSNDSYRTDLLFYIPQLCNYMVFHNDLGDNYLSQAVERACKMNFYFAHKFYFYLVSLEKIVGAEQIQVFKKVTEFKQKFIEDMNKIYEGQMLNSVQHFIGVKIKTIPNKSDVGYLIKMYGNKDLSEVNHIKVSAEDITLPNYSSMFNKFTDQDNVHPFLSTINFFQDMFIASQQIKTAQNRKERLRQIFQQLNLKLPACTYVPFVKQSAQFYNILNIVVEETQVFSTKQRAPFYVCLEVYEPIQPFSENIKEKYHEKMTAPITLKINASEAIINKKKLEETQKNRPKRNSIEGRPRNQSFSNYSTTQTQVFNQKNSNFMTAKLLQYSNEMETQPRLSMKKNKLIEMRQISTREMDKKFQEMFGESQSAMHERIKEKSIYKDLKTWKLLHIIIKTDDNLKQQQFALQLIYQFDYIFKLQNLPLVLTPYEVLSMGPDCGIIEMVKDSITLDKLKKYLKNDFGRPLSLKQFFELYFADNLTKAKELFMRSLAAYSLVMYFLQAKDRHNGNIMLHRSGKIFHIDFGFFLSNMPGKGVQLEKTCPFKLLSEYIDVLDGPDSYYFKKFRQYLFQGFKAVRKHQNKILMLVKMMYSSSGMSMPCFEKGEEAIKAIEKRFNPDGVITDAQLNLHCQKLINSSLDNWATKWYDRFQYLAQGIFY